MPEAFTSSRSAGDALDDGGEERSGVGGRIPVGKAGDEGPEVHGEVLVVAEREDEPLEGIGLAAGDRVLGADGFDLADGDGPERRIVVGSRNGVGRHGWEIGCIIRDLVTK